MSSNTVTEFANELKMAPAALLEQLRGAGVRVNSVNDAITEADKAQLLESLHRAHGAREGQKITLTRKQTSEIRQADASGRARTIPVEVRKRRVFVKRDAPEPEAAPQVDGTAAAQSQAAADTAAAPAARASAPDATDLPTSMSAGGSADTAPAAAAPAAEKPAEQAAAEQPTPQGAADEQPATAASAPVGEQPSVAPEAPEKGAAVEAPASQTPADEAKPAEADEASSPAARDP